MTPFDITLKSNTCDLPPQTNELKKTIIKMGKISGAQNKDILIFSFINFPRPTVQLMILVGAMVIFYGNTIIIINHFYMAKTIFFKYMKKIKNKISVTNLLVHNIPNIFMACCSPYSFQSD